MGDVQDELADTFRKGLRLVGGKLHTPYKKAYSYCGALPPMIPMAGFRPDLDGPLASYVTELMERRGCMDGRVVWHVLHLREVRYGIGENR